MTAGRETWKFFMTSSTLSPVQEVLPVFWLPYGKSVFSFPTPHPFRSGKLSIYNLHLYLSFWFCWSRVFFIIHHSYLTSWRKKSYRWKTTTLYLINKMIVGLIVWIFVTRWALTDICIFTFSVGTYYMRIVMIGHKEMVTLLRQQLHMVSNTTWYK